MLMGDTAAAQKQVTGQMYKIGQVFKTVSYGAGGGGGEETHQWVIGFLKPVWGGLNSGPCGY
jgi:hypothetical protein